MNPTIKHTTGAPSYDPTSRRARAREFLAREITLKDVLTSLVALGAIVGALGWTLNSPGKRIEYLSSAMNARFDTTSRELAAVAKRTTALEENQRFHDYLLCVIARRVDPASAAPDCAPIIEARSRRKQP